MTDQLAPFAIHAGLAVYRFGGGEPILFMPGPHRFQRPGPAFWRMALLGIWWVPAYGCPAPASAYQVLVVQLQDVHRLLFGLFLHGDTIAASG